MKKGRKKRLSPGGVSRGEEIAAEISAEIGVGEEVARDRTSAREEDEPGIRDKVRSVVGRAGEVLSLLRTRESLQHLLRIILPTVYTVLTAAVPSFAGIYPFGVSATLATVGGIPALLAAAGAAAASLFLRGGAYVALASLLCAGAVTLISRLRSAEGRGGVMLRGVFAIVIGVGQTVVMALSGGITFYEVCGVAVAAALCPLLTVSLCGVFTSSGKMNAAAEGGILALIYTAAYLVGSNPMFGESLPVILSFGGAVAAAYIFGLPRGIAVGVMLGLAAPAKYALVYPIAAAVTGMLSLVSPMGAVAAASLLSMSYGVYSGGGAAVGDLFPEMLFCTAVLGPLFQYRVIPRRRTEVTDTPLDIPGTIIGAESEGRVRGKLRGLSGAFSSISAAVSRMSVYLRRPDIAEAKEICHRAMDESCAACSGRDVCWEKEYRDTSHAVSDMANALRQGREPSLSHIPEGMRGRCPYLNEILHRAAAEGALFSQSGGGDGSALLAQNYATVSRLLCETEEAAAADLESDKKASDLLERRLRSMGVKGAEVTVYGDERRRVLITGIERGCPVDGEEIRLAAGGIIGHPMTMPEYRIDGKRVVAMLRCAEAFDFTSGKASVSKRGERCGDTVISFKGEGGYFYTLISDGMGSGGEAAMTSGTCAMFLEKLLSAGTSLNMAFEMLNSYLVSRHGECFATVDLMEADLVTGKVKFVKSGAAPSFVLRGGRLFRLSSKTVPVGIISPFDAQELKFSVKDGDIVVMISDGALPDGEEGTYLYDLLCGEDSPIFDGCDPTAAAREIAEEASKHTGRGDDVSVAVVRVTRSL